MNKNWVGEVGLWRTLNKKSKYEPTYLNWYN